MAKAKAKAGTSKESAAHRRKLFVNAFLANGRNATQAAITAGYSEKTARSAASRLLADVNISAQVAERTEKIEIISGLTVERTLQELARIAYFDPRKAFRDDGSLKPLHELDDDTAATLAGVEVLEEWEGRGEDREQVGLTKKVKFWDKNSALEKAMKHLGLFARDNSQRAENLALQVVLIDPPKRVAA